MGVPWGGGGPSQPDLDALYQLKEIPIFGSCPPKRTTELKHLLHTVAMGIIGNMVYGRDGRDQLTPLLALRG